MPFPPRINPVHYLLPLDFGFDGVIKLPPMTAGTHALKTRVRDKICQWFVLLRLGKEVFAHILS